MRLAYFYARCFCPLDLGSGNNTEYSVLDIEHSVALKAVVGEMR